MTQIILMYRGDNGKMVYRRTRMKPAEYPKSGEWGRIIGEAKIPEGRKNLGFAVQINDPKPEGSVLIRNPELTLREE